MSKFCIKCGAVLEDNAGFCGACGTKQETAAPAPAAPAAAQAPQPADTAAASADNSPIGAMSEKMSQMSPEQKKKIGIIAAVVAVVIILIVVVVAVISELTKYQKIDCTELYYVSYSGINGQATAEVYLATPSNLSRKNDLDRLFKESEYYDPDWEDYNDYTKNYEKFIDSITSKWLKTDKKDMKKAWTKFDSNSAMKKAQEKLIDNVEFKIDDEELVGLSNGDVIHVKVKYSESKLKKKNIKLENTEFTITVQGLVEPEVLDPLSNIKVTFSGNDGRGTADIDKSGMSDVEKEIFSVYFDTYFYNDLSNGDKVTVRADTYYWLDDGYFMYDGAYYTYSEGTLTKDFTVEGLKGLNVLDPFEGVELKYSGIAPDLSVSVNTDNCDSVIRECIDFNLDKSYGVAIGDTITLTASVDYWYEEEFADYGYRLESDQVTKTFTIEDTAPHYINDIKDADTIDAETLFEEVITSINESAGGYYLAGNYVLSYGDEIAAIKSVKVDDTYLVAPSDVATSSNTLYQFFKVDTTCTIDGASKAKTFYVLAIADEVYVDNGALAYDDWWISTAASESKSDLLAEYVNNDSNKVAGKSITSNVVSSGATPPATEPTTDDSSSADEEPADTGASSTADDEAA